MVYTYGIPGERDHCLPVRAPYGAREQAPRGSTHMCTVSILTHAEAVAALATRGAADEDVITSQFKLPLIDRYSLARLVVPCRGTGCEHHEAFELSTFEMINRGASSPLCPICSAPTPPQSLRVDELVLRLLVAAPGAEVILTPDGKWEQNVDVGAHSAPGAARGAAAKQNNVIDLISDDDDDDGPIEISDEDDDNSPIEMWTSDDARTALVPLASLPSCAIPAVVKMTLSSLDAGVEQPRAVAQHHHGHGASGGSAEAGCAVAHETAADLAAALLAMNPAQLCRAVCIAHTFPSARCTTFRTALTHTRPVCCAGERSGNRRRDTDQRPLPLASIRGRVAWGEWNPNPCGISPAHASHPGGLRHFEPSSQLKFVSFWLTGFESHPRLTFGWCFGRTATRPPAAQVCAVLADSFWLAWCWLASDPASAQLRPVPAQTQFGLRLIVWTAV